MSISFIRKIIKIFIKLLPVIDFILTTFAMTPNMVVDVNTVANSTLKTSIVYEV